MYTSPDHATIPPGTPSHRNETPRQTALQGLQRSVNGRADRAIRWSAFLLHYGRSISSFSLENLRSNPPLSPFSKGGMGGSDFLGCFLKANIMTCICNI